jgi:hypothetical protein
LPIECSNTFIKISEEFIDARGVNGIDSEMDTGGRALSIHVPASSYQQVCKSEYVMTFFVYRAKRKESGVWLGTQYQIRMSVNVCR